MTTRSTPKKLLSNSRGFPYQRIQQSTRCFVPFQRHGVIASTSSLGAPNSTISWRWTPCLSEFVLNWTGQGSCHKSIHIISRTLGLVSQRARTGLAISLSAATRCGGNTYSNGRSLPPKKPCTTKGFIDLRPSISSQLRSFHSNKTTT